MAYSRSKFGDITSQSGFVVGQFSVPAANAALNSGSTFASDHLNSGVRLNPAGSADIFVGNSPTVGITNGYELDGEVFIDVDSLDKVFVVGSAAGSTISFVAS